MCRASRTPFAFRTGLSLSFVAGPEANTGGSGTAADEPRAERRPVESSFDLFKESLISVRQLFIPSA